MPAHRLLIGNDVVDRGHRRCPGKSRDFRFIERVLHPQEASAVLSDPDPDRLLWIFWSAKEAAFKALSKALPEAHRPVFSPRRFVVRIERDPPHGRGGFSVAGVVRHGDWTVPYRSAADEHRVHTTAWSGTSPGVAPPEVEISTGEAHIGTRMPHDGSDPSYTLMLGERFTVRERRSIHSPASAFVRLMARAAIAADLGVEERRLEIVCGERPTGRTPPTLHQDGQRTDLDLSLSHHGQRVAWAYRAVTAPRDGASSMST